MARPPERLAEMLPQAALIVDATVKEVVSTGAPIARPDKPKNWSDVGTQYPEQILVLEVARVLKGALSQKTIRVKKPVSPYLVRAGVKGAWLLDKSAEPIVLGRYGPDSWSLAAVEFALKA